MSDPKEKDRATLERDRGVGDRGLWVVPPLRALREAAPKQDRLRQPLTRCRPEVAESVMMRVLAERSTEDIMRLYADSFLADDAAGHPFPTTYGPGPEDWERRIFPRCWLRANRPTVEEQLRQRFHTAEQRREFERLSWYRKFVDNPSLNAPDPARNALRRILRDTVSRDTFSQAQRDWAHEAIERLHQGLRRLAERVELAGNSREEIGSYVHALTAYGRVILDFADGGTGDLPLYRVVDRRILPLRPDLRGAEEARLVWRRALEDAHRRALLPPPGSRTSRLHDDIRSVLINEIRRQLRRSFRSVGWRRFEDGRDVTEAAINELAEGM